MTRAIIFDLQSRQKEYVALNELREKLFELATQHLEARSYDYQSGRKKRLFQVLKTLDYSAFGFTSRPLHPLYREF